MSSPLAIAAVSAVLRNLLDNGLVDAGPALGSTVNVSAVAPDTIDLRSAEDAPRLNIFLFQATPNAAWRNAALPSRSATSGERLTNAPLALDLHYVITAYARADFQAEILLGYAMHLLHERPVLDRAAVRRALQSNPLDAGMLPPTFQALSANDLADQVELIKLTHEPMSTDELSRLWAAIQSNYRPSATYVASVVLIEGTRSAVAPLPVLTRGKVDPVTKRERGVVVNPDLLPALPTLFSATPPASQTAARLGETIVLEGIRLAGTGHRVRLAHRLVETPIELVPTALDPQATRWSFALPATVADLTRFAAGNWSLSLRFTPVDDDVEHETNAVPLMLAPVPVIAADAALDLPGIAITREADPARVRIRLAAKPQVRPEQRASLLLDGVEAVAAPRKLATDLLDFSLPASTTADKHWLRLRVDGVDSVLLDRSGPVPVFDPLQQVTVPA